MRTSCNDSTDIFLAAEKMVRMCKMKGCKVRQGDGKLLFSFPKDPVMREKWISRTERTQWNPTSTSCICEVNQYNRCIINCVSH